MEVNKYGSTAQYYSNERKQNVRRYNNSQSKSTEKLSSGYRINCAADDAAGLQFLKR